MAQLDEWLKDAVRILNWVGKDKVRLKQIGEYYSDTATWEVQTQPREYADGVIVFGQSTEYPTFAHAFEAALKELMR